MLFQHVINIKGYLGDILHFGFFVLSCLKQQFVFTLTAHLSLD